ncbi:HAD hydrolase-like protein [Campylobacter sp. 2018MI01]|uniref:HAD hydrolase-like protein n=1 Tax=Campylobacter sp. 2018MI01 TaxID=2836735 RepID=UPI001BDA772D|nr:HAD hydrolase-like protein [Campylobacter sp. 2018MI01]MBT0879142.1 HAD hydrolase-like protein [Campylobacter sp. 2018MI01]
MHIPSDNCECRKPKAGLILQAAKEFNLDLFNSIFIGDKVSDMQAAINANINNRYLFNEDLKEFEYCKKVNNLLDIKKDYE